MPSPRARLMAGLAHPFRQRLPGTPELTMTCDDGTWSRYPAGRLE
jgi:hypothetical protein